MKNTIKLLMCAVVALCFASCTPESETPATTLRFGVNVHENDITVVWDAVTSAVYYEVQLNDNEAIKTDKTSHKFEDVAYDATYTISLQALDATGNVLASDSKTVTVGPRETPAYREWVSAIPATAISDNAKWAVGAMGTDGIIIDLTTDEMTEIYSVALYDVDDNGVGVGSYHGSISEGVAAMYVNGEVIEVDLSAITKNNSFSTLTSITPDGSYAVGWYAATENDAYAAAYGGFIPFCYDVVKNKVSVPEPGSRLYNDGELTLHSVAPDRSILGCDQAHTGDGCNIMLNTIWEDEYTPYTYIHFTYDASYQPIEAMGGLDNRFSASGRYVYGNTTEIIDQNKSTTCPAIFDRESKEIHKYSSTGAVTAMTDDGVVFINTVPYGSGITAYVTDLTNSDPSAFVTLEEWLYLEHGIDVAKIETNNNTDPDNELILDGVIVLNASADGRTILATTSSTIVGWVNTVIYLDGIKE